MSNTRARLSTWLLQCDLLSVTPVRLATPACGRPSAGSPPAAFATGAGTTAGTWDAGIRATIDWEIARKGPNGQTQNVPALPGFHHHQRQQVSLLRGTCGAKSDRPAQCRRNGRRLDPASPLCDHSAAYHQ